MDGCEGPGGTFNEAYATGTVTGQNYVGGFIGQSYWSTVNDAYTVSDVSANNYVGGFAGYSNNSTFNNVYSSGVVQATGDTNMAGFIGEDVDGETEITNSFWNGEKSDLTVTCGNGSPCGGATKSTTTLMNTEYTFTNATWDFEDIWKMDGFNNQKYPFFLWQTVDEAPEPDPEPEPKQKKKKSGSYVVKASVVNLAPVAPLKFTKTLKPGITGPDIKLLQTYLNAHGYPVTTPGQETTYYGPKTKAAVVKFQKANNLIPDAIVGPKTSSLMK
jgi:hypothetical protein